MATVKDKVGQSTLDYINQYFPTWSSGLPTNPFNMTGIGNTTLVVKNQATINGTSGTDVLAITDNNGFTSINGAAGNDVIVLNSSASAAQGAAGRDFIMSIGDLNVLDGGADADMLVAYGNANLLKGGAGNDYLISISGECIGNALIGGAGNDTMDALQDFYSAFNFSGKYASYTITRDATVDGKYKFVGPDGTDTVFAHRSATLVFDNKIVQLKDLFPDRAPVAVSDTNSLLKEDTVLVTTGNVLSNDRDPDADPLFVKSVNGTNVPSTAAGLTLTNSWGTLNVKQDGSYTFTLNNGTAQQLGAGVLHTETFSYIAASQYIGYGSSPSLSSNSTTLKINITGVNDAATITGTSVGAVKEDVMPYAISGNLVVNDVDAGQNQFQPVSGSLVKTYGTFTFNNGAWTYTLNNGAANVQALVEGQEVHDTLTVVSQDGTATKVIDVTITGTAEVVVNQAPTAVVLSNEVNSTAENGAALKVADIAITDDGLGTNTLSLSGADAGSFYLVGNQLWFNGSADFEAKASYDVRVNVDDTTVGGTPDAFTDFHLNITNVNEAPTANNDTFDRGSIDGVTFSPLVDTNNFGNVILGTFSSVNILNNDTDPDGGDTKTVISATSLSYTLSGPGLLGLGTTEMGGLNISPAGSQPAGTFFTIAPTGVLINGPDSGNGPEVAATLIINSSGTVILNKGTAFDFLPSTDSLTLHFSYTIEDSGGLTSTADLDILITGQDNKDVFVGPSISTGSLVLSGGIDNDIMYGGTNSGVGTYYISGDSGNNILKGGANNGSGSYRLDASSSSGNNTITGGTNNSGGIYIIDAGGSSGNNTLNGGANSSTGQYLIQSGMGDDTITGASNSVAAFYTIKGDAGDDTITGGPNANTAARSYTIEGGAGDDTIQGAGTFSGNTALYRSDVLNTNLRGFVNGTSLTLAQGQALAVPPSTSVLQYALFLTAGFINVQDNVGTEGNDKIVADTTVPFGSSVQFIDFSVGAIHHTYTLVSGPIDPPIVYNVNTLSAGDNLVIGGQNSASGIAYQMNVTSLSTGDNILIGGDNVDGSYNISASSSPGNNILIGGENSSAQNYVLTVSSSSGNNLLIGGTNSSSANYNLIATLATGNNILVGGTNAGSGIYRLFGGSGMDFLYAGANASGNVYDQYILRGGGGTNTFVSNTGQHVFDGTGDTGDTAQYHQDVLGGNAAGDIRAFINGGGSASAVAAAMLSGSLLNYNFSLLTVDAQAPNGGILVDSINAAVPFDGNDLLVGNTTAAGPNVSTIPNIAFNELATLLGTNHSYTLFNGPANLATGSKTINGSLTGDDIVIGGINSAFYSLNGDAATINVNQNSVGNDILFGGQNLAGGTYQLVGDISLVLINTTTFTTAGNDVLIGAANSGVQYNIIGDVVGLVGTLSLAGNDVIKGGINTGTGSYTLIGDVTSNNPGTLTTSGNDVIQGGENASTAAATGFYNIYGDVNLNNPSATITQAGNDTIIGGKNSGISTYFLIGDVSANLTGATMTNAGNDIIQGGENSSSGTYVIHGDVNNNSGTLTTAGADMITGGKNTNGTYTLVGDVNNNSGTMSAAGDTITGGDNSSSSTYIIIGDVNINSATGSITAFGVDIITGGNSLSTGAYIIYGDIGSNSANITTTTGNDTIMGGTTSVTGAGYVIVGDVNTNATGITIAATGDDIIKGGNGSASYNIYGDVGSNTGTITKAGDDDIKGGNSSSANSFVVVGDVNFNNTGATITTSGDDIIKGGDRLGNGAYFIVGDVSSNASTITTAGDDTITGGLNAPIAIAGTFYNIYGDVDNNSTLGTIFKAGDDTITGGASTGAGRTFLIGDVSSNSGAITTAGNDDITGGDNSSTQRYEIFGDVNNNFAIGTIATAGDDIIRGGNHSGPDLYSLVGDVNVNAGTIVKAGDDIITAGNNTGGGSYSLIGDIANNNTGTLLQGGNNTLISGQGNEDMWGSVQVGSGPVTAGTNTFVFDVAGAGNGDDNVHDFIDANDVLQFNNATDLANLLAISDVVNNGGFIRMTFTTNASTIDFTNINFVGGQTEISDYITNITFM